MGSLNDAGSPGYIKPRYPTWLWRGGTVSLEGSAPPDQFMARLASDTDGLMASMRTRPVLVGRVSPPGHMLVGWSTPMFSNSWMSFLDATVASDGAGVQVRGSFRLNRAVAVVSALLIVVLLLGAAVALVSGPAARFSAAGLFALGLLVFFIATLHVARLIALKNEPRVVDYLRSIGAPSSS